MVEETSGRSVVQKIHYNCLMRKLSLWDLLTSTLRKDFHKSQRYGVAWSPPRPFFVTFIWKVRKAQIPFVVFGVLWQFVCLFVCFTVTVTWTFFKYRICFRNIKDWKLWKEEIIQWKQWRKLKSNYTHDPVQSYCSQSLQIHLTYQSPLPGQHNLKRVGCRTVTVALIYPSGSLLWTIKKGLLRYRTNIVCQSDFFSDFFFL